MKPEDDPELTARMRALGRALADVMPPGHGFVLFTFGPAEGGMTTYVSNAHMHDVLRALKAFIRRMDERDKHLS